MTAGNTVGRSVDDQRTVTIPSGGSNSGSLTPGEYSQGTFQTPAALTGTTITVQFSNDDTNWTAAAAAISVSADSTYVIPADAFKAKYIRFVSNGTEAAARILTLFLKG